jgi:hypothetical protein
MLGKVVVVMVWMKMMGRWSMEEGVVMMTG